MPARILRLTKSLEEGIVQVGENKFFIVDVTSYAKDGRGILDLENPTEFVFPFKNELNIIYMDSGSAFHLALDSKQRVWSWGSNTSGQLGTNTPKVKDSPRIIFTLPPVRSVSCGLRHAMALDIYGRVWVWGEGSSGQMGNGETMGSSEPLLVKSLPSPIVQISAGNYHNLALDTRGRLWYWGGNVYLQLDGTSKEILKPLCSKLGGLKMVCAGAIFSLVINNRNVTFAWGPHSGGNITTSKGNVKLPPITSYVRYETDVYLQDKQKNCWCVSGETRYLPERLSFPDKKVLSLFFAQNGSQVFALKEIEALLRLNLGKQIAL